MVAIAIGCVALWNQVFALWSAGYDIVGFEPRRSVPWGPRDVVVILIGVGRDRESVHAIGDVDYETSERSARDRRDDK